MTYNEIRHPRPMTSAPADSAPLVDHFMWARQEEVRLRQGKERLTQENMDLQDDVRALRAKLRDVEAKAVGLGRSLQMNATMPEAVTAVLLREWRRFMDEELDDRPGKYTDMEY